MLPYEALLPLPFAEVRRLAGLEAPEVVHPGGVIEMRAGPSAA